MVDTLQRRVAGVVANDLAIDEPSPHFDMVQAGLIDSLALVGLVVSLEAQFGCRIPPDRVNGDTFATVDTITALLREIDGPQSTPSGATVESSSYPHRLLLAAIGHPVVPVRWRASLLRRAGLVVGKGVEMYSGAHIGSTGLRIGDGVFVNHGLFYDGVDAVAIGDGVSFGPHVRLVTAAHRVGPPDRRCDPTPMSFPITIGDGCWLAAAVTVLPGVTIAPGCVIANGAVVGEDTDPDGLYSGVPARRTRDLNPSAITVVPQQRANSAWIAPDKDEFRSSPNVHLGRDPLTVTVDRCTAGHDYFGQAATDGAGRCCSLGPLNGPSTNREGMHGARDDAQGSAFRGGHRGVGWNSETTCACCAEGGSRFSS